MRRNPRQEAAYCANRVRGMLDEGFRVTDKQTGQLRRAEREILSYCCVPRKTKRPSFSRN